MPNQADTRAAKLQMFIATQKLLFLRGYSIVGIAGIVFLIASQLQTYLQNYGLNISMWWLYPVAFGVTWLTGLLEVKLGVFAAENQYIWESNPAFKRLEKQHDEQKDQTGV